MKVIHIVGPSGSGKTRFISDLLTYITPIGLIATIKHLGHHRYKLEVGKDTTIFFQKGICLSVGIDDEKTVIAKRGGSLNEVLGILSDQGVNYTLIEGFKTLPLPKIVIGALETKNCVLIDPDAGQVIKSFDLFPDYYTLGGLAGELVCSFTQEQRSPRAHVLLSFSQEVIAGKETTGASSSSPSSQTACADIENQLARMQGICGARVRFHPGTIFGGMQDLVHVVIRADTANEASYAMKRGIDQIESRFTAR